MTSQRIEWNGVLMELLESLLVDKTSIQCRRLNVVYDTYYFVHAVDQSADGCSFESGRSNLPTARVLADVTT
jgi:hypothetical protein